MKVNWLLQVERDKKNGSSIGNDGGSHGDAGGGGSLVVIRGFLSYEGKLVLGLQTCNNTEYEMLTTLKFFQSLIVLIFFQIARWSINHDGERRRLRGIDLWKITD